MKTRAGIVVLGGAGTIGRVVVRDLFESLPRNQILIADFNESAAHALAKSFRSRRLTAGFADASKPGQLARLMRGHAIVVNCTQHDFNLRVMGAALDAGVHYLDLGGLFMWTRRQLKLVAQFKRAGLTAVIGMGCAPGIVNVMARYAADQLERVHSIKIRVASAAPNSKMSSASLVFPYSAQTIVEELTLRPWVFARGRFRQVKPRTGWELIDFGLPVGRQWLVRTRHSEVATLPLSLRAKGLKYCDFKVGFDRPFVREIVKRLRAGWTAKDFAALPKAADVPDDYEISRVIAEGWTGRGGDATRRTIVMDCHARANREWRVCAGDVDTGCPASIVAQMIARGEINAPGVWPSELVVPARRLFEELNNRGLKVTADGRKSPP
jgi:saccharopine dehydrogenase-like NADP-dependent oxidoreductase